MFFLSIVLTKVNKNNHEPIQKEGGEKVDEVKKRYYTVSEIKKLESCGRDKAYEIASNLPHETRGRQMFVFADEYEKYYEQKKAKAIRERKNLPDKEVNNVYQIKKFS